MPFSRSRSSRSRQGISENFPVFSVIGSETDAPHGIGIRERLLVAGVAFHIHIDTVERDLPLSGQTGRFHQRVGRLDEAGRPSRPRQRNFFRNDQVRT